MSEECESYEELVKKLKPCSVVFHRISDEKYAKLKVVDDPNRIRDQVIPTEDSFNDIERVIEEEIEIDISVFDIDGQVVANNDTHEFKCFFCQSSIMGYEKAFIHFQYHIDYYPVQCSICDEANVDITHFVDHCKKQHQDLTKVKFIKKFSNIYNKWIEEHLNTRLNGIQTLETFKYCPSCDWIHLEKDVNNPNSDSNPLKPMQILKHIHEHIQYKPFQCKECRKTGEDFRFYLFDSAVRKHVQSHHPHLIDGKQYTEILNKRYVIQKIDKFIVSYLTIFGQKVPKSRFRKTSPKTKEVKETKPHTVTTPAIIGKKVFIVPKPQPKAISSLMVSPTQNNLIQNNLIQNNLIQNSLIQNNLIQNSLIQNNAYHWMKTADNQLIRIQMPKKLLTQNASQPSVTNGNTSNFNRSIATMEDPVLLLPASDKINLKGIPVESTDLNVICLDPRTIAIHDRHSQYVCVFCKEKKILDSLIDAMVHYSVTHFDYKPVICMFCNENFVDLSALLLHYEKEHNKYRTNLFHYLKEDERLERWIIDFLNFQKTHLFLSHVSVPFGDYCLVCKKISNENGMKMKCKKSEINAIRDHINHHLSYFPYKCVICFHGQRTVRFGAINSSALDHFFKFHDLTLNANDKDLSKLLVKSDEIIELEKLIDESLFPNREQTFKIPIDINLKRKLDDLEISDKAIKAIAVKGNNGLGVEPHLKQQAKPHSISIIANNKTSNGIESPAKSSAHSTQNGVSKSILYKPIEYIPNQKTFKKAFLLCFHCHTRVSNTSELESHHNRNHPKLTIASYSPTTLDMLTSNATH